MGEPKPHGGHSHRVKEPIYRQPVTRKPLTEFHLFTGLPVELRLIIWEMAIIHHLPARIHYYSLFNEDRTGHRTSHLPWFVPKKPAPMEGKKLTQRQIRKRRRDIAAGRTIVPIKEGSSTIYMDYSPRDIVCFRFAPEHLAACKLLDWRQLLTRLPFYQLPQASALNLGFEFEDGWERGLDTLESVRAHLGEDSVRGLILRLHWAWSVGEVPLWTRIFLINPRKDLPDRYFLGRRLNHRYTPDLIYREHYNCRRKQDLSFFDGKERFVHSNSWVGFWGKVPICKFMRNVNLFCRPQKIFGRERNLPHLREDRCLVVLRNVSGR
ncbi:unnamed protein product [Clonostachys byssicola]|uniref:2EXR domain-containing protein n=1 Tax=Clonostachys byssicola TaxID=160290 RepID=A0A9N9XUE7_9HYPO|nr:unnamed protein product [Clonostachys byssicola]